MHKLAHAFRKRPISTVNLHGAPLQAPRLFCRSFCSSFKSDNFRLSCKVSRETIGRKLWLTASRLLFSSFLHLLLLLCQSAQTKSGSIREMPIVSCHSSLNFQLNGMTIMTNWINPNCWPIVQVLMFPVAG